VAVAIPETLEELLKQQGNCVTHEQATERGKTRHEIATLAGIRKQGKEQWQRLHRGVYYAAPGPVPRLARLWGAVLRVGHGGVLSHETAAEMWGFSDEPSDPIHVSVPRTAGTLPPTEGIRLHYSSRLPKAEFGVARGYGIPPLTWAHDAVLDLASTSDTAEDAVNWAIKACQRGKTTPDLIAMCMLEPGHRLLRWRGELTSALADIHLGVQSPLEQCYLRDVERAHQLPEGRRQVKTRKGTSVQYHDVRYPDYGVGVELDELAYHRGDAAETLRYGWLRVAYHPCEVAHEVWTLLVRNGYREDFRRCGPSCTAPASPATAAEIAVRLVAGFRAAEVAAEGLAVRGAAEGGRDAVPGPVGRTGLADRDAQRVLRDRARLGGVLHELVKRRRHTAKYATKCATYQGMWRGPCSATCRPCNAGRMGRTVRASGGCGQFGGGWGPGWQAPRCGPARPRTGRSTRGPRGHPAVPDRSPCPRW
jgi:hypothetical protein